MVIEIPSPNTSYAGTHGFYEETAAQTIISALQTCDPDTNMTPTSSQTTWELLIPLNTEEELAQYAKAFGTALLIYNSPLTAACGLTYLTISYAVTCIAFETLGTMIRSSPSYQRLKQISCMVSLGSSFFSFSSAASGHHVFAIFWLACELILNSALRYRNRL